MSEDPKDEAAQAGARDEGRDGAGSAPSRPTSWGRRRVLKWGLGALAALASGVALVRTRGYDVPEHERAALLALSVSEFVVVRALARRICAADADDAPSVDAVGVARWVDGYIAQMDRDMARDLRRFLSYIEQVAPLATGHAARFSFLPPAAQDEVLHGLEESRNDLFRGGFQGVKALVFMGYYRDPRTWSVLDYDGPTIGRQARNDEVDDAKDGGPRSDAVPDGGLAPNDSNVPMTADAAPEKAP